MYTELKKNKWIKLLISLKITSLCLLILFILTFAGTVYQAGNGLYAAQQRFFYSWIFFIWGFIPFPGAQLVMWVLGFNLLGNAIFKFNLNRIGIFIMHWGIIVLLLGSFITHYYAKEYSLSLYEGTGTNLLLDYSGWELAIWESTQQGKQQVYTYDLNFLKKGKKLKFPVLDLELQTLKYYKNAIAIGADGHTHQGQSFIDLKPRKLSLDSSQNLPGCIFFIKKENDNPQQIIVWARDSQPKRIMSGSHFISIQIQRKRHQLPFTIKLLDFIKEEHPGTRIARNFESLVEVIQGDVIRKARIFMNNPLRFDGYTFYQSSYDIDPAGREISTLSVVVNKGRILPYISSSIIFLGLLIHFCIMLFKHLKKRQNKNGQVE